LIRFPRAYARGDLLQEKGFDPLHITAICPFFEAPASKEYVDSLDDDEMFKDIQEAFRVFAEAPDVLGLSSRLLIVARKKI